MADILQRLISHIPFAVTAQVEPVWGSDHADHREHIRQARPREAVSSVSHCRRLGGWVAIKPTQKESIGFDIEELDRISQAVVKRICTPQEFDRAPNFCLLWSAKEAYFKALGPLQPRTVSQVEILAWEPLATDIFRYRTTHGPGWCGMDQQFTFAICVLNVSD